MPEPRVLSTIIDRACFLFEEAAGHPPDRREVAESVLHWLRLLPVALLTLASVPPPTLG